MTSSRLTRLLAGLFASLVLLLPAADTPAQAKPKTPVYAYASPTLETALRMVAVTYKRQTQQQVEFVFGPVTRLHDIIHKGGHLDLVLIEDPKVIEELAAAGMADPATRTPFIGTTLVLAAPAEKPLKVEMKKGFDFAKALKGNLAVVSVKSGAEGALAKQAMERLGWLEPLKGRFLIAEDGKTAARAADKGDAGAALIYAPDVTWVMGIDAVATFPEETHDPIVFEGVVLKGAHPKSADFLAFLKVPKSQEYFQNARFTSLPPAPPKK